MIYVRLWWQSLGWGETKRVQFDGKIDAKFYNKKL